MMRGSDFSLRRLLPAEQIALIRPYWGRLGFGLALLLVTVATQLAYPWLISYFIDHSLDRVEARWLVGCDGGHSLIRRQAGIAFKGETSEEIRMIVADVQVEGRDRDARLRRVDEHVGQNRHGRLAFDDTLRAVKGLLELIDSDSEFHGGLGS